MEIIEQLKMIISNSIGGVTSPTEIDANTQLVGNLLDSLAVNSLILGIEEFYGFTFDDDDLSADAFETVESLSNLIQSKLLSH